MMFMQRKSVILVFKVMSVLFVCFLMCVFCHILFSQENIKVKIDLEIEEKNEVINEIAKGSNSGFNNITDDKHDCDFTVFYYYIYALILGAYFNVNRLCKLGTI